MNTGGFDPNDLATIDNLDRAYIVLEPFRTDGVLRQVGEIVVARPRFGWELCTEIHRYRRLGWVYKIPNTTPIDSCRCGRMFANFSAVAVHIRDATEGTHASARFDEPGEWSPGPLVSLRQEVERPPATPEPSTAIGSETSDGDADVRPIGCGQWPGCPAGRHRGMTHAQWDERVRRAENVLRQTGSKAKAAKAAKVSPLTLGTWFKWLVVINSQ